MNGSDTGQDISEKPWPDIKSNSELLIKMAVKEQKIWAKLNEINGFCERLGKEVKENKSKDDETQKEIEDIKENRATYISLEKAKIRTNEVEKELKKDLNDLNEKSFKHGDFGEFKENYYDPLEKSVNNHSTMITKIWTVGITINAIIGLGLTIWAIIKS